MCYSIHIFWGICDGNPSKAERIAAKTWQAAVLPQKHKFPFPKREGEPLLSQSILDARNAAPARSFRHSLRHSLAHARVKRRRQNVLLVQFILANQPRNGIGCRALHLIVDVACPHIKRARGRCRGTQARCSPGSGNRSGRWQSRARRPPLLPPGKFPAWGSHRQTGPHPSPWFLPFPL